MGLRLLHLHLHGLFRSHELELGRDADTGGQTLYVLELVKHLARQTDVDQVDVVTRLIKDPQVSSDYAVPEEPIASGARILRFRFGPDRYLRKERLWPHLMQLVDRLVDHLRQPGQMVDWIHAHYADAGLVGSLVSERLGFAVVGVGRFGIAVCRELLQNGAEVLAVDRSERAVDELRQLEPTVEARVVDCTDEESLREAGVLDMGTVVVAMSEPIEASITATLIAKDSEGTRVRQVIARATSELHEKMLKRVGADRVIFPSRMQGERLGLELVRPNLMERLALDEKHCIEEIKVPEPFMGRSLRDLNLRKNFRVNVLAAGPQSNLTVNPPASHVLEEGHLLVVMGLVDDLQRLPKT